MNLSKGKITILKAGPYTSIQDGGRFGYAEFGIPTAGFMDATSAGLANLLLGNPPTTPCFEIFAGGVSFKVHQPCLIASSGAEADLRTERGVFKTHQPVLLKAGEIVEISPFRSGQWLYLSLAGNVTAPSHFGSKSFYYPVTNQSRFMDGDEVEIMCKTPNYSPSNSRISLSNWKSIEKLPVFPGPEFHKLSFLNQQALFNIQYTVSTIQNRMGVHINELLENDLTDMLSAPVFPGTVQLTPSGKLIVLMRDAQVTGGYPRIMQLTESSISLLAQKRPGEAVSFTILPRP
jgi:biotin-dependent carboxylase-like uncharacterized protein